MNVAEIINKKANNISLQEKEINFIMEGIDNYLSDYQLSAFLMAVKINGFSNEELFFYTNSIIKSGKKLPLNDKQVDKHSSGGVGDKISLILLPFLSIEKIKSIKFSGKGLGFTGGTIDKLSTVKNLKLDYSIDEIKKNNGNLILSSNKEIVPLDAKTYSIRDVTGSVDSLDLVASSIMSKKIVSGAKNILIDLKVGSGSFFKNIEEAKKVSKKIKFLAKKFNRNVYILFTNMDEPLGSTVGNSIEIKETIDFLQGKKREPNLEKLVKKIVSVLYQKVKNISLKDAEKLYEKHLNSNNLFQEFISLLKFQHGNTLSIEKNNFFNPNYSYKYKSTKDGFLSFKDISNIGYFLISLKAGRKDKNDKLYLDSGIEFHFKTNQRVKKGETILTIYSKNKLVKEKIDKEVSTFISINKEKINFNKIIINEIPW